MSGKRGSNPRPPAWKASALSTELFPRINHDFRDGYFFFVGADGFEPPKVKTSRFTVCPIWPLWNTPNSIISKFNFFLSLLSDSNQRPRDYKSRALANWAKEAGLCTFCHALKNTSAEKRCKGSAFFWHDQMFCKKNAIFLYFFTKRGAKQPLFS